MSLRGWPRTRTDFANELIEEHCELLTAKLKYDLRFVREGKSWMLMAKKGRPLPEWITNEPAILPEQRFFLEAFWDLTTTRQVGMSPGPIPWNFIEEYARTHGLDRLNTHVLHRTIRSLDSTYLGEVHREHEKNRPNNSK